MYTPFWRCKEINFSFLTNRNILTLNKFNYIKLLCIYKISNIIIPPGCCNKWLMNLPIFDYTLSLPGVTEKVLENQPCAIDRFLNVCPFQAIAMQ